MYGVYYATLFVDRNRSAGMNRFSWIFPAQAREWWKLPWNGIIRCGLEQSVDVCGPALVHRKSRARLCRTSRNLICSGPALLWPNSPDQSVRRPYLIGPIDHLAPPLLVRFWRPAASFLYKRKLCEKAAKTFNECYIDYAQIY